MSFSGKATYSGGSSLPEVAEDVADLVTILSPQETPLLDALGDPLYAATSTRHEWLEDSLLSNTDSINQPSINDASLNVTAVTVANGSLFQVGDLVQAAGSREVLLVTAVAANVLTVTRGYGGSTKSELADGLVLVILGNAALEGQDAGSPRFTIRTRQSNYTQIFSAALQISGTEMAVRQLAVEDELDYQKTLRLRELLRDLENTVINGVAPAATLEGSATVRRTMRGLIASLSTNLMTPGGGDHSQRRWFERSAHQRGVADHLGGFRKQTGPDPLRRIPEAEDQRVHPDQPADSPASEQFKNLVSVYESDYGVCRVIFSRYVPADTVLFVDSSKVAVVPLTGRSFGYLAVGDHRRLRERRTGGRIHDGVAARKRARNPLRARDELIGSGRQWGKESVRGRRREGAAALF